MNKSTLLFSIRVCRTRIKELEDSKIQATTTELWEHFKQIRNIQIQAIQDILFRLEDTYKGFFGEREC